MFWKTNALSLLLGCVTVMAQQADWAEQMRKFDALGAKARSAKDYRLGPGDLIEISIFGVERFSRELRVSASGKIGFPFLGKIDVDGLSGEQVELLLTQLLAEQELVKDPQVSVFIKEYRSQPVYVLGAVNQPGQYMMTQQLTLLDALTMAGGLDQNKASDHLLLQRRNGQSEEAPQEASAPDSGAVAPTTITRIDITDLLEKGNLALNIPIQGGDVIQVPERKIDVYFVVGEVGRAGAFEFPKNADRQLLLSHALAHAGGPARTAKMSEGVLVRYDADGSRQEHSVDFKAILRGKQPDIPVQPNDIIFVPGSTFKTLGYGLLGVIPGTVQGAVIFRP